jgi:hypothetical protein
MAVLFDRGRGVKPVPGKARKRGLLFLLLFHLWKPYFNRDRLDRILSPFRCHSGQHMAEAKSKDPDWGDKVDTGIGLRSTQARGCPW